MRSLFRILRATILAFVAFVALSVAAVFGLGERYDLNAPASDAIVILSGNYVARGLFVGETRERTEAGLALALAGRGRQVAVTGGDVTAEKMAEELVTGGVAPEAIVIEREATSTLQNALFTRALLPQARSVIVVTHRYHLPRAIASFRWAGFPEVHAYPADKSGRTDLRRAFSESIKLPLNMARAAAFSALTLAGVPQDRIAGLLG